MEVYLGIDWGESSHAVVFVDGEGKELCRKKVEHSVNGFGEIDDLRRGLGVTKEECVVGVETAHNLIIDWLLGYGYSQVYVIPPNVTRSRQRSYRQSGAKTDESDGYLIGNLLRTERHRMIQWRPDSELTQRLRAKVRLRSQLVVDRTAHYNQLRQTLLRYYPAALEPFGLNSRIALDFVQRYPTPAAAGKLKYSEFESFAKGHRYPANGIAGAYAKLGVEQPTALPITVETYQEEAVLLAQLLSEVKGHIGRIERSIAELFSQHADREIFASLPGVGEHLAPALLVKFGDDRERFPDAGAIQALAGTAPVTSQSGKSRSVRFRQACDHEFRTYMYQWAALSIKYSPWAATYYAQARQRGLSHNHTCRALGNRWLKILWKLWQNRECYDQDRHLAKTLYFRQKSH
ncbi:MAG: IS110 family transposase [Caldilineaceae bacterium]|jgi:transposase